MRIVDVSAFYTPLGGGVRSYVDRKLAAAAALDHEVIVLAPGKHDAVIRRGAGAVLETLASPPFPAPAISARSSLSLFRQREDPAPRAGSLASRFRRGLVAMEQRVDGGALGRRGAARAGHARRSAVRLCLSLVRTGREHRDDRSRVRLLLAAPPPAGRGL